LFDFDGFDWDDGNWPKCGSHGLEPYQIEAVFNDPDLVVAPDAAHSVAEQRWIAVGRTVTSGHWTLVIFTRRGRAIRPVSARYMHRKEVLRYVGDQR
jgi:uncharacterized protein